MNNDMSIVPCVSGVVANLRYKDKQRLPRFTICFIAYIFIYILSGDIYFCIAYVFCTRVIIAQPVVTNNKNRELYNSYVAEHSKWRLFCINVY